MTLQPHAARDIGRIVVLVVLGLISRPAAQEPSLGTVLERASTYVAEFKRALSGIVAEEEYLQEMADNNGVPRTSRRLLKSDLLLVRSGDTDRYVEFRDVFEVDGRQVRDRKERLTKLFLDPQGAERQLQQIIDESARYNLGRGRVQRNINIPTLALLVLDRSYRARFKFTRVKDGTPNLADRQEQAGTPAPLFRVTTEMWVIEYRETSPSTIVRTPDGKDIPARGRFWVEPSTGHLLMTELLLGDPGIHTTIDVSYQSEPLLGFLVPIQMRERYEGRNLAITGTATYRNFRRFTVNVDETLGPFTPGR